MNCVVSPQPHSDVSLDLPHLGGRSGGPVVARLGFGGFELGGMQLALPMAALREVIPCSQLLPLPAQAACVVGGVDLRGVVVPVVDLRLLLGREAPALELPTVLLVVDGGRILGLLIEAVTGIFSVPSQALHPVQSDAGAPLLLAASLRREEDGALVSVLSPQALMAWPRVPLVLDPEPERQVQHGEGEDSEAVVIDDRSLPLLLFRCAGVPLAVDAMAVHATLSQPQLERSVLQRGDCLGVIDYAGTRIAAVDLMALCGLGQLPLDQPLQAIVLQLQAGLVACLIHEVIDVVRLLPEDVLPVPVFARPHPRLFAGALPLKSLSAEVVARAGVQAQQFLLLDGQALHSEPALLALAETNTAGQAQTREGRDSAALGGGRSMLIYALGGETATALEQITEILPYTADIGLFSQRGPLLGMLVNRGRSIPVMCLSRLTGHGAIEATPAVSVLVVEHDNERFGYAVPALRAIEPADWEPSLPTSSQRGSDELAAVLGERKLAMVGKGSSQRMLRVLDLRRLSAAVRDAASLPG